MINFNFVCPNCGDTRLCLRREEVSVNLYEVTAFDDDVEVDNFGDFDEETGEMEEPDVLCCSIDRDSMHFIRHEGLSDEDYGEDMDLSWECGNLDCKFRITEKDVPEIDPSGNYSYSDVTSYLFDWLEERDMLDRRDRRRL